jgi:phosphotransferase system enzyme I (PtsP)
VLGRVRNARGLIREGDLLLLDGDASKLTVRPIPTVSTPSRPAFARSREKQADYAQMRDVEPFTRDGQRIEVMMNAGLRDDIPMLSLTGADGIGLFRTEFQFLVSAALPQRDRQTRLYRDVLEAAGDKPVIFRTVDIGGDKSLPYLRSETSREDENPAMGWRALRLALEREGCSRSRRARCSRRPPGAASTSCSRWSPSRGNLTTPRRCSKARSSSCAPRARPCPRRSVTASCSRCPRSPRCSTC